MNSKKLPYPKTIISLKMVEVGGISCQDDGDSSSSSSSSGSGNDKKGKNGENGRSITNAVFKALFVVGGFILMRRITKPTARVDHTSIVAEALCGEKFSSEQAARDPMNYFNHRILTCPVTTIVNGSKLLYSEQAFWRTPEKPYRQRFYVVKPCTKDLKCDVEVASYAIKDIEEYRNFCGRPNSLGSQSQEVLGDVAEHLSTVYLSQCERGRRCLYEGSTPPGGFPNLWNGATHGTSELKIYRDGEIHCWDKAYDGEGNQVWGVKQGPYEFKPVSTSTSNGSFLPVGFPSPPGGYLESKSL